MSSQMSSAGLISDRYASALYELAADADKVDAVLRDLEIIQKHISDNKELKLLIKSPLISSNDKLIVLEKILKNQSINNLSLTFLRVISKNKRFANLLMIISEFININAKRRGDVLADITSADELSFQQKNGIKDQLRSILGEKLSLNFKVDKKIIGGLIVNVGSKMIDSSLASKINKIKIAIKGA